MRYFKNLYLTERAKEKKETIIRKLEDNSIQFSVYLLLCREGERMTLEICHAGMFLQAWYPREQVKIAGMAVGYEEALELLVEIVEDAYQNTGNADVCSYLKAREEQGE